MLDQNDLKILADMFAASEERVMKRIDRLEERIDRLEERMDRLEERMNRLEVRMDRLDERVGRLEKRVDALEEHQKKMEANLYDEVGRVQSYFDRKLDAVRNDVSEMKQYYRIERVENATSATILKIVSSLQKDVEELKQKIA